MLLHQLMVGLLVLTVAQFCLVCLFLPSESVRPPAMLRLEDDVERLKAALGIAAGFVSSAVNIGPALLPSIVLAPLSARHGDTLVLVLAGLAALTAVAFLGLAASTTRSSRTLLPNDENRDMRADEAHERHRQATSTNESNSKLLPMTTATD